MPTKPSYHSLRGIATKDKHGIREGKVTALPAGANAGKSREMLAAQYQALAKQSH